MQSVAETLASAELTPKQRVALPRGLAKVPPEFRAALRGIPEVLQWSLLVAYFARHDQIEKQAKRWDCDVSEAEGRMRERWERRQRENLERERRAREERAQADAKPKARTW